MWLPNEPRERETRKKDVKGNANANKKMIFRFFWGGGGVRCLKMQGRKDKAPGRSAGVRDVLDQ